MNTLLLRLKAAFLDQLAPHLGVGAFAAGELLRAHVAHAQAHGRELLRHGGLGRKLHDALKQCLIAMGITNMCALIAVPHDKDDEYLTHNSQDFHAHMGYRLVGAFDRCAQKFGRWYDMCWMELVLAERTPNQPKPTWFPDLPKPTI